MDNTEFERLSRELDLSERQELLSKINKPDTEEIGNTYTPTTMKSNKETQLKMAENEYKTMSFLEKIRIFFQSMFSGERKEEIIVKKKLNKIKKKISDQNPTIVNFDKKILTSQFVAHLLNLIKPIEQIQQIVTAYFSNEDYFNGFLRKMYELEFSESLKKQYNDCLPQNLKNEDTAILDLSMYNREKEKRIKKFFSALDSESFSTFVNDVRCFDKLMRLINYNFRDLMFEFSVTSVDDNLSAKNYALFKNVENKLDYLNSIIADIDFGTSSLMFLEEYPEYFRNKPISESMEVLKQGISVNDVEKIFAVLDAVNIFKTKIPLTLIQQYFKSDMLYTPKSIPLQRNFPEVYKSIVRENFNTMWEEHYMDVRRNYLRKLLSDLYPDFHFDMLQNYTVKMYTQAKQATGVKMTSIFLLNLILFFVTKFYRTQLEAIINRILIDGEWVNEQYKFHLSSVYHSMGLNVQKLQEFDNQMSTDNEFGKKIMFYVAKSSRTNDENVKKTSAKYVEEINNHGMMITKDFMNSFNHLASFFQSVSQYSNKSEKQIKNFDSINIGVANTNEFVEKMNKMMNDFFKVYKYIENVY